MEKLKEIVNQFAENYKENRGNIDGIDVLENELYQISGTDKSDPSNILLIPINSPDLENMGSVCGNVGNRVFSSKSLVSFLKNKEVKQFLGIIQDPNDDGSYENGTIALNSVALPIAGRDGHIFESLASKNGGSFRYERSRIPGWSVYESE